MIDWDLAVTTGVRLVRPGPQVSREEARQAVLELRRLSRDAEGHVREFTRIDSAPPEAATVVDRPGWIRANVDGFRVVLEPLTQKMSNVPAIVGAVGSRITGLEVGAVLAFLASRVLGQYELFLPPDPSGVAPTGRLTLVAPNIVHAERELGVDPRDFRLWVCLHEETHRVQFTGVPWLREYVRGQMTEFLLASEMDLATLLERLRAASDAVADAFKGGEGNLIEAIQTPEQKAVLDRVTAVMTLVEGHGDYVMDAVGPSVVPSVAEIRAKFQRRREGGSRVDQLVRRLLGIELKMKQYAEGSRFVRTVVDEAGMDGFNKVWTSPETLPDRDEIADPHAWMSRVLATSP
ncbi:coenzyme F420 biosynthesis-associated protein [Microbispora triticiradicis]|uniref:Coenzyme F420 biosynthesis-associated protein n=2 Tax=Microbispora triticiradicis TaxID=2200763 RepID=A0ABX9LQR6_9ACTN|nr:coenzyme F420 biosynthesis-associated protein [Microbispora triticiradicis]RGA06375.1 coenzyme F420 biosynthesis-associated protein [Microbispora triticiradicis]TLP52179.1 coenzyme F420 biosynthesis-associated protein [Microbispora fusca]